MPLSNVTYDYIADLAGRAGTDGIIAQVASGTTLGDRGGGNFRWADNAINTIDGINVIGVAGMETGRWIRLLNNNYNTGTFTFPIQIGVDTYVVTHGLSFTPSFVGLTGSNKASLFAQAGVTTITNTTFTVLFGVLPVSLLTGNFRYTAMR